MYYRRKILLALLDAFGGEIGKIKLQKLLFLYAQSQSNPTYYFVPYKYGTFSFQANADLNTMKKYDLVMDSEKSWIKKTSNNFMKELKDNDRVLLSNIKSKFMNYSTNELIKYTYVNYPYYAINSSVAEDHLSPKDYDSVKRARPINLTTSLFTIGYEGISLEQYINKLIKNDIKILYDVRNSPRSMKYGFSKSQLQHAVENVGITYIHLPKLGIVSNKRKSLETQEDYDILFDEYKATVLKTNISDQEIISVSLKKEKRVALTCFEANIKQCHRYHLANSITDLSEGKYKLQHI